METHKHLVVPYNTFSFLISKYLISYTSIVHLYILLPILLFPILVSLHTAFLYFCMYIYVRYRLTITFIVI